MVNMLSVDKYLKKAKVSIIKGNISEAEAFYKLILQNYPENKRAKEGLEKINDGNRYNYNGIEENISILIKLYNAREYKKTLLLGHQLYLKYSNESIIPNILGAANAAVGNFEKAIVLYENALKLKPLNPHVYNNLGLTYKFQGSYSKAIEHYEIAGSILQSYPIEDQKDLWNVWNNLAILYKDYGMFEKAKEIYQKLISFCTKYFGKGHINNAVVLQNCGVYQSQLGYYESAIEYFEIALQIYKQNIEPDHQWIGVLLGNLAKAYENLGNLDKALEMNKNSKEILEKNFGVDHPKTLALLSNLGNLYEKLKKYNDAENLYKLVLTCYEKNFGKYSKDYLLNLNQLALLNLKNKSYKEAFKLFEEQIKITSNIFQREAPYLPNNDRYIFYKSPLLVMNNDWFIYSFSSEFAAKITMLWKLNLHGSIVEMEKKQSLLVSQNNSQKNLILEIKEVIENLANQNVGLNIYKDLKLKKDLLEKELYKTIPKLKPEIIDVDDISKLLKKDDCLI